MPKPRKTPGSVRIPADVLANLNAGTRQSANLVEGLAVDFVGTHGRRHPGRARRRPQPG